MPFWLKVVANIGLLYLLGAAIVGIILWDPRRSDLRDDD